MTPHDTSCRVGDASGDLPDAGAPEVEITPAMIEAGVNVLKSFNRLVWDNEAACEFIFLQMYRARP